jgi:hypothetical protein
VVTTATTMPTPSSEIPWADQRADAFCVPRSIVGDITDGQDRFTTPTLPAEKPARGERRDSAISKPRRPAFSIRGEVRLPSLFTSGLNPHSTFTSEPGTEAWTTTAPKSWPLCSPTNCSSDTTIDGANATDAFDGFSMGSEFPDPLEPKRLSRGTPIEFPDPLELAQPCSSRK